VPLLDCSVIDAGAAVDDLEPRAQTMTSAHSLQGLMKWLRRDEWRERFAEAFDAHLLTACEQTGLDADEVVTTLGEDWFTRTVWGSAFEDFLTRDFDDGSNIVDDYLKRRGWKESPSTRTYMAALRSSVPSLYEVSDIVKDTSFKARDLVQGGDPILIIERSATRSLKQWDRIATRVVQVGSQTHISGAILQYDYEASEKILALLRPFKRCPLYPPKRTLGHRAMSAMCQNRTHAVQQFSSLSDHRVGPWRAAAAMHLASVAHDETAVDVDGVSTAPGQMQFEVILSVASTCAAVRVMLTTPAFLAV
jgi:hypothetical protein